MSLMQLLSNGKTLVDLKHSTSRYHMPGKNFLPKFGPVKNPFATPPPKQPAESAATARKVLPPTPLEKSVPTNLKETKRLPMLPANMKETKRLPFVATRRTATPPPAGAAWWEKFLDWAGELMARVPAWWAARKAPVKSAIPRFDKPVVQGELSLENIKVVRNDLHDADLEVVPAKTFTGETNFKPSLQPQVSGGLALSRSPVA